MMVKTISSIVTVGINLDEEEESMKRRGRMEEYEVEPICEFATMAFTRQFSQAYTATAPHQANHFGPSGFDTAPGPSRNKKKKAKISHEFSPENNAPITESPPVPAPAPVLAPKPTTPSFSSCCIFKSHLQEYAQRAQIGNLSDSKVESAFESPNRKVFKYYDRDQRKGDSERSMRRTEYFIEDGEGSSARNDRSGTTTKKRKARFCEAIVPGNLTDRWSTERYKLAEKNLSDVMILKGATAKKPIRRPQLQAAARKRITDTGLLGHLLKHMPGELASDGEKRFRRRHNEDGSVEYWLESADLVNIRSDAGVTDPYWVPPPGWRLGDPIPEEDQAIVRRNPNPKCRWSIGRYKLAEKNLLEVMILNCATARKSILRPLLRAEARNRIGDTGLLDHLLAYMDGKLAPNGEKRFRRRQNEDGSIEFWLESVDATKQMGSGGQSPLLGGHHNVSPPPSSDHNIHISDRRQLLKVGSLYEINHAHLPPRTPSQLRSVRLAMVCEKTEMNVAVRFPSMDALRTFFNYSNMERHPALDEKFVMGTVLAEKVLYRPVPAGIFAEQKSLERFWLLNSDLLNKDCLSEQSSSADDGNPGFENNGEYMEKVSEKEEDENSDYDVDEDENVKVKNDDVEESEKGEESEKEEEYEKILRPQLRAEARKRIGDEDKSDKESSKAITIASAAPSGISQKLANSLVSSKSDLENPSFAMEKSKDELLMVSESVKERQENVEKLTSPAERVGPADNDKEQQEDMVFPFLVSSSYALSPLKLSCSKQHHGLISPLAEKGGVIVNVTTITTSLVNLNDEPTDMQTEIVSEECTPLLGGHHNVPPPPSSDHNIHISDRQHMKNDEVEYVVIPLEVEVTNGENKENNGTSLTEEKVVMTSDMPAENDNLKHPSLRLIIRNILKMKKSNVASGTSIKAKKKYPSMLKNKLSSIPGSIKKKKGPKKNFLSNFTSSCFQLKK